MEGTCGKICDTSNGVVRKVIKRKYKGFSAMQQYHIQQIAINIVKNNNLKLIVVPKVFDYNNNSYSMEKIDDSNPYYTDKSSLNDIFKKELLIFYKEFEKNGYFPNDFECFLQKDNKICIVDFDKFIKINDKNDKKFDKETYLKNPFIPQFFYY